MQPDLSQTRSGSDKPPNRATTFFSTEHTGNVTEVAQALAAHGGGAVSVDLAFDLVLNELVQHSRDATGATGAAIALLRDGEIVCRATAGDNAPDLGVRVETTSSLAGACLSTGQIQQCRDTDTDPRVNAEVCRQLGVRSMLIAPLIDGGGIFGILQVFSAWPSAFGEREVSALQGLAQAVAENKRQAEASTALPPGVEEEPHVAPSTIPETVSPADDQKPAIETKISSSGESEKPSEDGFWTSVLSLLVICVALLLGVAIGWHGALKGILRPQPSTTALPPKVNANSVTSSAVEQSPPVTSSDSAAKLDAASNSKPAATANSQTQGGGLVVTENGKVIYRSPSEGLATPPRAPALSGTRLIHRVLPEYPAQARAQNIQGPVVLDVQIGGSGEVAKVDVVSGDPLLADAAVQAVKQWRYKPYVVDGRSVESQTRVTIKFTLPPR